MKCFSLVLTAALLLITGCATSNAQTQVVGFARERGLIIADKGASDAIIVVSPDAGVEKQVKQGRRMRKVIERRWEKQAATDLAKYIELMSGARPKLATTPEEVAAALRSKGPVFILGEEALKAEPSLRKDLAKASKQEPVLRADAIVLKRKRNRVYLAGSNDDSHYYAMAHLLRLWGCRWYLPTEIGECIPERPTLTIEELDYAYSSPFEVRGYWISWVGDNTGKLDFQRRNMMNNESVPSGHALRKYTGDLVKEGQSHWNVPVAEDATAQHVAAKIAERFGKGERISLGMEDGTYRSDSPIDKALNGNMYDKYFMVDSLTDPFMVFYNKVCRILQDKYPESNGMIGFLAYVNLTMPPQRPIIAEKPLVAYLAPIDIDPTHGMDDVRSPPRQEYREILYRWAKVMQGRVIIYDYDQGMLVWRSIPNPSIQAIRQDIKHYRDAGILGIGTESRNAIGTTFLNLHVRGRLMWEPDLDVDALLAEFYPKFYGPVATPMSKYWGAIFKAWEDTICTEHEFFVAPAIYTPQLVAELKQHLETAEARMAEVGKSLGDLPRDWARYQERMKFARLSFNVIENYMGMVFAGARDLDYKAASAAGQRAIVARDALADMNGTFTTFRKYGDKGPAWLPGEVKQYTQLLALTDGTKGKLVAKLPLEWAFRRDPNDSGLAAGIAYKTADLTYWKAHAAEYNALNRKDYPITQWEMVRTDLYPQAQGVLHPDWQAFTGYSWTKTPLELTASQVKGPVHLRFPGLFAESWLYVNGYLIAHRPQNHMWWRNNYKFEWDVDLTGKLKKGVNDITLRVHATHHVGGMFRRPFLYRPVGE